MSRRATYGDLNDFADPTDRLYGEMLDLADVVEHHTDDVVEQDTDTVEGDRAGGTPAGSVISNRESAR